MSNFKPIGKWIWVQSHLGGQKETEAGIIYNEVVKTQYIWATVAAIGDKLTEDIRVGDRIMWDRTKNTGQGHLGGDMVHQDWVALVER